MLVDDPNDVRAFQALSEVVRRRAAENTQNDDPLAAAEPSAAEDVEQARRRAADLAVWALAEELAGNPRAWYPLIELSRLSLDADPKGAIRRLSTAADREPTGQALVAALTMLRGAGHPVAVLGLGTGHWRAREHTPEVGRQVILAALEADRVTDAKRHLESLALCPDQKRVAEIRGELEPAIALAERRQIEA